MQDLGALNEGLVMEQENHFPETDAKVVKNRWFAELFTFVG